MQGDNNSNTCISNLNNISSEHAGEPNSIQLEHTNAAEPQDLRSGANPSNPSQTNEMTNGGQSHLAPSNDNHSYQNETITGQPLASGIQEEHNPGVPPERDQPQNEVKIEGDPISQPPRDQAMQIETNEKDQLDNQDKAPDSGQKDNAERVSQRVEESELGNEPDSGMKKAGEDSHFMTTESKMKQSDSAVKKEEEERTVKPKEDFRAAYPYPLPSSAAWFSSDEIHQLEKDAVPEFFQGKPSKTPELYKKYRNFIIRLYLQNPRQYLTAIACRRCLAGDANSILRIHTFLEHQGLINFGVDQSTRPQSVLQAKVEKNPSFYPSFTGDPLALPHGPENKPRLFSNENDLFFHNSKIIGKNMRPTCSSCGNICGVIWFQQKVPQGSVNMHPDYVICVKCFTENNFPPYLNPQDFGRIDYLTKPVPAPGQVKTGGNIWNFDETTKLYELIAHYGTNWDRIAAEFPNHTREEIILHYLQLPQGNLSKPPAELDPEEDHGHQLPPEKIVDNTDHSIPSQSANPLVKQLHLFHELVEKYNQKNDTSDEMKEDHLKMEEETSMPRDEGRIEHTNAHPTIEDEIKLLNTLTPDDGKFVEDMEKETIKRANALKELKERKLRGYFVQLLDLQLSKLELKLNFLEEFEKTVWNERAQLDVLQRINLAERAAIVHRRNEVLKQQHFPVGYPIGQGIVFSLNAPQSGRSGSHQAERHHVHPVWQDAGQMKEEPRHHQHNFLD